MTSSGELEPYGKPLQARPPGEIALEGEVQAIQQRPVGDQLASSVRITLQLDSDKPVVVQLAPDWYLDEQGLRLEREQHVTVVGPSRTENGRQVVTARELRVDGKIVPLRDAQGNPIWAGSPPPRGTPQPGSEPSDSPPSKAAPSGGKAPGSAPQGSSDAADPGAEPPAGSPEPGAESPAGSAPQGSSDAGEPGGEAPADAGEPGEAPASSPEPPSAPQPE